MEPVFIGGAGRSGTTLLADLLGMHPNLSPIYETDFVLTIQRELAGGGRYATQARRIRKWMDVWTRDLPHRPHNKREHERYVHGPHHLLLERDEVMSALQTFLRDAEVDPVGAQRTLLRSLFARHASRDGKPRWVNKTPGYVRALPTLRTLFRDLRFVHCVRDGRDVVASVLTRPWGPDRMETAGPWWVANVLPGLEFEAAHPGQVLRVRYEDLLTAPVETLGRVLAFIGEPADDAADMVSRYAEAGHVLSPARSGAWRETFGAQEHEAFLAVAGPLLEGLGYDPRYST